MNETFESFFANLKSAKAFEDNAGMDICGKRQSNIKNMNGCCV